MWSCSQLGPQENVSDWHGLSSVGMDACLELPVFSLFRAIGLDAGTATSWMLNCEQPENPKAWQSLGSQCIRLTNHVPPGQLILPHEKLEVSCQPRTLPRCALDNLC